MSNERQNKFDPTSVTGRADASRLLDAKAIRSRRLKTAGKVAGGLGLLGLLGFTAVEIAGCGPSVSVPPLIPGAGAQGGETPTPGKTETPTVTDLQAFTQTEIDALTSSKDSDAKTLAINKLQTYISGNVDTRSQNYEAQDLHGNTLKFGLNRHIDVSDADVKKGVSGITYELPGFAVIGINVKEIAGDGSVHQLLLTTNDRTFKSGWVKIDLKQIGRNAFGAEWGFPGISRGKGGQPGWANNVWDDTVGEIIEVRFPTGINSQTALTQDQLNEYLKLERYLANENNARPSSVLTDLNNHTFNTVPLPYWSVTSFNG